MSRILTALLVSLTMTTIAVAAQAPQTAPPTQAQQATQQTPEVMQKADATLTGCLVQGSAPTVFILEGAKMNPEDTTEQPATYRVVTAVEDLFLRNHLDHKVTISGAAEKLTEDNSGAGKEIAEADLPELDARSVMPVADTCAQ